MKRILHLLILIPAGALFYCEVPWASLPLDAQTQGRPPRIDYTRFKHSSHAGKLKASRKGTLQQLDCAYCHGTPTNSNPDTVKGYPYRKYGQKNELTHSACSDCHAITGRDAIATEGTFPTMCLICHENARFPTMARNLRSFPNPAATQSQFFDRFSHQEHAEKSKEKDSFECAGCHTPTLKNTVVAKIQFAAGVRESLPGHSECFVCHFSEKEVPRTQVTFATNCVGCHAAQGEQTGKGSEPSVHWSMRQIVNPEGNPTRPGQEPTKPFSHHESHVDEGDKDPKTCLACHVTGRRAEKRSDFFLEDRETGEKQPPATSCHQCHNKNGEMQQKIEGAAKLEASTCLYCHSLQTIKDRAARGAQLPPANHFSKSAPTSPAPTPKPESKPESKPPGKQPSSRPVEGRRAFLFDRAWALDRAWPPQRSFVLAREFKRDCSAALGAKN